VCSTDHSFLGAPQSSEGAGFAETNESAQKRSRDPADAGPSYAAHPKERQLTRRIECTRRGQTPSPTCAAKGCDLLRPSRQSSDTDPSWLQTRQSFATYSPRANLPVGLTSRGYLSEEKRHHRRYTATPCGCHQDRVPYGWNDGRRSEARA
jgi:hypothetical protein